MYVGGRVVVIENCDSDTMSLLEIEEMAEKLGYTEHTNFYYRVLGVDTDCGLFFFW